MCGGGPPNPGVLQILVPALRNLSVRNQAYIESLKFRDWSLRPVFPELNTVFENVFDRI